MFQSFNETSDPTHGKARVAALRAELKKQGLAGFLIPRADEHQGEYVPPHAERLSWLTGFSGSAGMAVVLTDKAAVFIDGRYTLQVRDQVDVEVFETHNIADTPPDQWIKENLLHDTQLGYDPWLHTPDTVDKLRKAAHAAGATIEACEINPLDTVWEDQPPRPTAPVIIHDIAYAGEAARDKLKRISEVIEMADAHAAVLTLPDSIAWLLNIRGGDVARTPLPLSFAIIHADAHADVFIDPAKLTGDTRAHLGNLVTLLPPDALGPALDTLGKAGKEVRADPATAASWIFDRLQAAGGTIKRAPDPCLLPKACKNATELSGVKAAHVRDGAALTRFLAWLSREAPDGNVDEISATQKLEAFRAEPGDMKDLSFDTISGSGPNGAIVHYRVTTRTNRALQPGELYLVDSGAQYVDGTTDVTRTVAIGTPSVEQRDRFTRVLKGHMGISAARFPEGTTGAQIDALARGALWSAGLDFDHGTGHGVGCYLSVHEGPQGISRRYTAVALKPGMIVSNEPGYYKTGAYGIRIENLLIVTPPTNIPGGERPMMGFDPLTRAPIDRNLIDTGLLTAEEIAWLNAYHATVRADLESLVDDETKAWLIEATEPLDAA